MLTMGLVDSHTPRAFTLSLTHFRSFSGHILSCRPAEAPIHSTSVFLSFSRRPEIVLNSCKSIIADVKDVF